MSVRHIVGSSVLAVKGMPLPWQYLFSRALRDSTTRFVGSSVRQLVHQSHFTFFGGGVAVFGLTAPAKIIE